MMKKRFSFTLLTIAAFLGLAGCSGNKETSPDATVRGMELKGLQTTAYKVGDTINWNALSVTVTFSDNSTQTHTKLEFDVDSPVSSETKVVVYTQGLHAQATLAEGSYKISAALVGKLDSKFDLTTISVGTATSEKYDLVEFIEPKIKLEYQSHIASAMTDIEPERSNPQTAKANEAKFIASDTRYTVGTLNPFIYQPDVQFENIDTFEPVDGSDIYFEKEWQVKVFNGENYVPADTNDYSYVDGYVKFNNSAIGKVFSLTMKLKDFQYVEGTSVPAVSTFEGFTVADGLNVYSALELGALNLTAHDQTYFGNNGITEHNGGSGEDVFWDKTTGYHKIRYEEVWKNHLFERGVFSNEELNAYRDVKGVFLHDDIFLTDADLPSDYFIKTGEFTGDHRVGSLRDGAVIFSPIVKDQDVTINGNFWTLDTQGISLCNSTWTGGFHPYNPGTTDTIMPGHSSLFKFCGSETASYFEDQVDTANGHKGIVKNINSRGNSGTDLSGDDLEKMLALTGLIFAKNDYCGASYESCIVKEYQIGLFCDQMVGQKVGTFEQRDNTFVKNCRLYDCANCGVFNYHNGGTHVSKSVFNRFGGAPLINAGAYEENRCAVTKFEDDVIFSNEITGEEIYIASLGVSDQVSDIKGFNEFLKYLTDGYLCEIQDPANPEDPTAKIQVLNLVSINVNGDDYTEATRADYYSEITLNEGEENEMISAVCGTKQWEIFNNAKNGCHDKRYEQEFNPVFEANLPNGVANALSIPVEYVTQEMIDQCLANEEFVTNYTAYVKSLFDEPFETLYASNFPNPMPKVPAFQTEVEGELFWTDLTKVYDDAARDYDMTVQLEGQYLSILLPVNSTCLNLIFRIG